MSIAKKSLDDFGRDPPQYAANQDFFHGNQIIKYINQNVSSLEELQILSELSQKFHNEAVTNRNKIGTLLQQSETLYIDSITENLDDHEKTKAAGLIANIIRNNPFLRTISLENNTFSKADLPIIINAVITAKQSPLLKTQLNELHLRNSISPESVNEVVPKLILLRQKYAMDLDVNPDIKQSIEIASAEKAIQDCQKSCEAYLRYLAKTIILPASEKDILLEHEITDVTRFSLEAVNKLTQHVIAQEGFLIALGTDNRQALALKKYSVVYELLSELKSDTNPLTKKENFENYMNYSKDVSLTKFNFADLPQEKLLLQRILTAVPEPRFAIDADNDSSPENSSNTPRKI